MPVIVAQVGLIDKNGNPYERPDFKVLEGPLELLQDLQESFDAENKQLSKRQLMRSVIRWEIRPDAAEIEAMLNINWKTTDEATEKIKNLIESL